MAVNIFEAYTNPISHERIQVMSHTPEALVMQWGLPATGYVPFGHIHQNQQEDLLVKKGCLRVVMNGKEHLAKAGERIVIPKGMAHVAGNGADEPLECEATFTPGLDQHKFFQCLIGLSKDGFVDKQGASSIPRMGYCLMRMKAACMVLPGAIPVPVFRVAMRFFLLRGRLSGWEKLYRKYTQD